MTTVGICCNHPDNGEFVGRLCAVDYRGIELVTPGRECAITAVSDGVVRISRRQFRYRQWRVWTGNWCWDALLMSGDESVRLVRYLKSLRWMCEGGPTDLCDWYDRLPDSAGESRE